MAKEPVNSGDIQEFEQEQVGILRNVRLLAVIGIVLLAVVGGLFYWFYLQSNADQDAQMAWARIRPYFDKGEYAVAIAGDSSKTYGDMPVYGLEYIVDEWSGTASGKIAALYLGTSYYHVGNVEEAARAYDIATGADDALIRAAAHAGLGAIAEEKGEHDRAAEQYLKAASQDDMELNKPDYLISAARNLESAGKVEEAIEQYKIVAREFSSSTANNQAQLALARHNAEL